MHAVIRRYRVRLGTMEQAARYAEKWFLPLVRDIPGFKAHYLIAAEENVLASLGLFETAEAAAAAIGLARAWFREEWGSFRPLPPEVVAGEVLSQAFANGRPVLADRRAGADRRRAAVRLESVPGQDPERRGGVDRRIPIGVPAEPAPLLEWQVAG